MVSLTVLIVFATGGRASTINLTRQLIGHSVRGRAIYAYESGDPLGSTVLVVGSIHGNEPAGIAVARRLLKTQPPEGVDLWVIPDLNPDGHATNTRQNAHGVDLNRNFPWRWRHLKGVFYSGRHSLSEPESRAAYRLIRKVQPLVSIWFHQPLGVVGISKSPPSALESRFARLSGLPLQLLPFYPGSAASWENQTIRGSRAFVVELPAGKISASEIDRYTRAVMGVSSG